MHPVTTPEVVVDAGAIAVLDGHDGVGQVLAMRATHEAITRARAHGIGAVAVRHSNHFGTCMYYTRRVGAAGCVGMLTSNGGPAMAPWGGRTKIIGTNPWSVAALHVVTTLTGSALLALALKHGVLDPDQVWAAAHVDEDWNADHWGVDEEVAARRAARLVDFRAAAQILRAIEALG